MRSSEAQTGRPYLYSWGLEPGSGVGPGRLPQRQRGGAARFGAAVGHHPFPHLIATPTLACYYPASPRRSSGKGQDGSAPPFWGSLPSFLSYMGCKSLILMNQQNIGFYRCPQICPNPVNPRLPPSASWRHQEKLPQAGSG